MALTHPRLTESPGFRSQIAQSFFAIFEEEQVDALRPYFTYYGEELGLLRKGISEESWQIKGLAAKTYKDVFFIVNVLRDNGNSQRPKIRELLLPRFRSSDELELNRSINLVIRLWLMVNMQESQFEGLRHGVTCIQWDDDSTLLAFLQSLFPHSRWKITAQSSRLGPYFTATFMQRVCGLSIEWTTSLHDHLRLDRLRKALKIFPYKCHLQALIDSYRNSNGKKEYV